MQHLNKLDLMILEIDKRSKYIYNNQEGKMASTTDFFKQKHEWSKLKDEILEKYLKVVLTTTGTCGMWARLRFSFVVSSVYRGMCTFQSWMPPVRLCTLHLYCICARNIGLCLNIS
jgi:hypothetical protein